MIEFNYISANIYFSDDFDFKVRKLMSGVRQLIVDLWDCNINDEDICVKADALSMICVSTPVSYCGSDIGTLTWKYDRKRDGWHLCGLDDLDNLFKQFKFELEKYKTDFYEYALLHILANNYTKMEV